MSAESLTLPVHHDSIPCGDRRAQILSDDWGRVDCVYCLASLFHNRLNVLFKLGDYMSKPEIPGEVLSIELDERGQYNLNLRMRIGELNETSFGIQVDKEQAARFRVGDAVALQLVRKRG